MAARRRGTPLDPDAARRERLERQRKLVAAGERPDLSRRRAGGDLADEQRLDRAAGRRRRLGRHVVDAGHPHAVVGVGGGGLDAKDRDPSGPRMGSRALTLEDIDPSFLAVEVRPPMELDPEVDRGAVGVDAHQVRRENHEASRRGRPAAALALAGVRSADKTRVAGVVGELQLGGEVRDGRVAGRVHQMIGQTGHRVRTVPVIVERIGVVDRPFFVAARRRVQERRRGGQRSLRSPRVQSTQREVGELLLPVEGRHPAQLRRLGDGQVVGGRERRCDDFPLGGVDAHDDRVVDGVRAGDGLGERGFQREVAARPGWDRRDEVDGALVGSSDRRHSEVGVGSAIAGCVLEVAGRAVGDDAVTVKGEDRRRRLQPQRVDRP